MKVDLSERELSYLSRAIFRQRIDKPEDEPEIAAALDPKISVARYRVRQAADAFGEGCASEHPPKNQPRRIIDLTPRS